MRPFLFRHRANAVTFTGIILAAWTSVMVWDYENLFWVLIVTLVVALTDFADGRIARKLKIVTSEGIFLDRVRDKWFMCPMFAFFLVDVWQETGATFAFLKGMIILILVMEFGLVVSMAVGLIKKFNISAHRAGKIKQVIYFVIVCSWLLARVLEQKTDFRVGVVSALFMAFLLSLAAIYALKSLGGYLERYAKGPSG